MVRCWLYCTWYKWRFTQKGHSNGCLFVYRINIDGTGRAGVYGWIFVLKHPLYYSDWVFFVAIKRLVNTNTYDDSFGFFDFEKELFDVYGAG